MLLASCGSDAGPGTELPRVVAAIGDSITRAANLSATQLGDNPEHAWVTGDDPDDAVLSHVERIAAAGEAPEARNVAASGATMADAPGQAAEVVAGGADYVTILMGGNDLCARTPERMTAVEDFEASFRQTMENLTIGLPEARVYVLSIPDVVRLWEVLGDSTGARLVWRTFGICGAVLGGDDTDADREAVRERNAAFNEVLREVCASHERCRDDGGAVFADDFGAEQVSPADRFHPSMDGQARLAEVSWRAGYWPEP